MTEPGIGTVEKAYQDHIRFMVQCYPDDHELDVRPKKSLIRKLINSMGPERARDVHQAQTADNPSAYIGQAIFKATTGNGVAKPRNPNHEDRRVELNRTYNELRIQGESDPTPQNLRRKDEAWQAFCKMAEWN